MITKQFPWANCDKPAWAVGGMAYHIEMEQPAHACCAALYRPLMMVSVALSSGGGRMFIGDTCAVDQPLTRRSEDAGGDDYRDSADLLGRLSHDGLG